MSRERFDDDEYQDRPPKQGMSTGIKVLIFILVGGGLCLLLCCGVFIYMMMNMFEFSQNPADAVATTQEITTIDIPQDQFPPAGSLKMNWFGMFGMKMAIYADQTGSDENYLVIASMEVPNANPAEMESSLKQSLQNQDQGNSLTIISSETREIDINGQMYEFIFSEATNNETGSKFRQITGSFPGKQGSAFILVQVPEEEYNEEAMMKMLDSIE
ncbi:MAG: hypothetical protein CL608_12080 [Anaerolineaceae bacterium]|nr:hypothetical protein [Anaerolineaceae bacterium]